MISNRREGEAARIRSRPGSGLTTMSVVTTASAGGD